MSADDITTTAERPVWNDGDRAVLVGVGVWGLVLVVLMLPSWLPAWSAGWWVGWVALPLAGFAAASYRHLAGIVTALAFTGWITVTSLVIPDPQAGIGVLFGFVFGALVFGGVGLRALADWMAGRRDRLGDAPRGIVVLLGVLLVVIVGFAVIAVENGPSA